MTQTEAYKILGLPPGTNINEIKKRYRQLMMQIHPDIHFSSKKSYAYNAQEINIAYSVLKRSQPLEKEATSSSGSRQHTAHKKKTAVWDAPVNEQAYMEREILHYAEDSDGTILGNFCIARGKYFWKTDEDFPLFLLSVYQCSKLLLDEIDAASHRQKPAAVRQKIQAELTYLLAQQFIDAASLLKELLKEEPVSHNKGKIFYTTAMLEAAAPAVSLKTDEILSPSRLQNHRLYLKNQSGQELGYLSFADDRLYYVIVPLFEQKQAQVKIRAAGSPTSPKRKISPHYHNLHLWIKLHEETTTAMPENLNLQISQLLERYSR